MTWCKRVPALLQPEAGKRRHCLRWNKLCDDPAPPRFVPFRTRQLDLLSRGGCLTARAFPTAAAKGSAHAAPPPACFNDERLKITDYKDCVSIYTHQASASALAGRAAHRGTEKGHRARLYKRPRPQAHTPACNSHCATPNQMSHSHVRRQPSKDATWPRASAATPDKGNPRSSTCAKATP